MDEIYRITTYGKVFEEIVSIVKEKNGEYLVSTTEYCLFKDLERIVLMALDAVETMRFLHEWYKISPHNCSSSKICGERR